MHTLQQVVQRAGGRLDAVDAAGRVRQGERHRAQVAQFSQVPQVNFPGTQLARGLADIRRIF